ncbi:unnamed protein product [Schistocephalus solidus]|uniref:ZP domain-containing protein n=1 Tax=Schistocephalus solidus TaxID=70667 RepID=A0A183SFG7_SCHSO|nr:unnamed protein product [Schistocephalus solidus]
MLGAQALQCEPVIDVQRGGARLRSFSLARMQENIRDLESSRDNDKQFHTNDSSAVTTPSPNDQVFFRLDGNKGAQCKASRFLLATAPFFKPRQTCPPTGNAFARKGDLVLIGVANVYLRCLLFVTEFSYLAPIISTQGEVGMTLCGNIQPVATCSACSNSPLELGPGGQKGTSFHQSDLPDLLERNAGNSGAIVNIGVRIVRASGIPSSFSKMILCHYHIFCADEPIVVLPKLESFSRAEGAHSAEDQAQEFERTQKCIFDHTQSFQVTLSNDLIERLGESAVSVEVSHTCKNTRCLTWSLIQRAAHRDFGRFQKKTNRRLMVCILQPSQAVA